VTKEKATHPLSRVTRGKAKFVDDDRGSLGVIEIAQQAPFVPIRMFWISGVAAGTVRGGHAHRACNQFFICLRGQIKIDAIDGTHSETFMLERGDFLSVVHGIYATETFLDEGSVLAVLCDRPYEPEDYIYERDLFVPRN